MHDPRNDKLASIIVNHSLELKKGEKVLIQGTGFSSEPLLRAIVKAAKAAGITSDKEIILYCETSARAGIVYMALKTMGGYPNVKVYDGGIYEWAATASNPME